MPPPSRTPPPGPSSAPLSHAMLARLQSMPRLVVPAVVLVLALVGLMAPPAAAVPALGLLLALLVFLASFSWAAADRRGRLLRAVAMGVLAGLLVSRGVQLLS